MPPTTTPIPTGGLKVTPNTDLMLAVGMTIILATLFLPVPAVLIDLGLAFSIALSVVILMVALWIKKPLDFSAFPTVLLIATMLRLSLNIATTRLILTDGNSGETAAGMIISGFANLVMNGDFVIGVIVFLILITVNFMVITKGATRIAEVGARFTLDAIPGKQMAIDADLSAGLIDEKEAQRRRMELEEESSFFGAMDGASKFVRGDAIAGLIITGVNIFGGIIIGVTRHGLSVSQATDIFTKLSVGDGLVSQIPALIISLAAGLLVSKGGTKGSADEALLGQMARYPRALGAAALLMLVLSIVPGLPMLPFLVLCLALGSVAYLVPLRRQRQIDADQTAARIVDEEKQVEYAGSLQRQLKIADIELCMGKHLAAALVTPNGELATRVAKTRRRFAHQYGFIIPEIKLTDDLDLANGQYLIKLHGTAIDRGELRLGESMVILDHEQEHHFAGEEIREPAFGMRAIWLPDLLANEARRDGFKVVDPVSVLLTHLSEVIRSNLGQLFTYRHQQALIDDLEPVYRKLFDDLCPTVTNSSSLLAVLKLLLKERVSIRNLPLILEAVMEVSGHLRRPEQILEHVRTRLSPQICGDLASQGVLNVMRFSEKWEMQFHKALRRDAKGEVVQFDLDPESMEQFCSDLKDAAFKLRDKGVEFALVVQPDARMYIRMIAERLLPGMPVLSHVEISRNVQLEVAGQIG
jgi:flagellar biosynthesis protein FlhA